jgi:hypothetical protein
MTSAVRGTGRLLAAGILVMAGLVGAVPTLAQTPDAGRLAVRVDNGSSPVLCAEEDNVTLTFRSDKVRRFRIEAVHPVYLAALDNDNWDADWTACDFGPETATKEVEGGAKEPPKAPRAPERVTIHETVDRWLVGLRFPDFWRKAEATVRVGDKTWEGLHLLQLWRVRPNGGEEVLVLYPQDGYWRVRPKAPRGRDLTAFGSSFLVGPVEIKERPIVRLRQVTYREVAGTDVFDLAFAAGGSATVRLSELSEKRLGLDVQLSETVSGLAFAAMRSMYVTAFNNDVERVAIRPPATKGWAEAGIMDFKGGDAMEVWAGRRAISQHNTSSPDMIFKAFGN